MNFVLQPWQLLLAILIYAGTEVGRLAGEMHCRVRLGGTLCYYFRPAA